MTIDQTIPLRRVRRGRPCPICAHTDWCEIRDDGVVHCMRVPSATPSRRQGGWWHHPAARREWPQPPPRDHAHGSGATLSPSAPATVPPYPARPSAPLPARAQATDAGAREPADLETRDRVYRALLAACPLSAAHRDHLLGATRQLPAAALAEFGTLPPLADQGPLTRHLARLFGAPTLLRVPGFVPDDRGGLRLPAAGLLIPARDPARRIQGVQVRQDAGPARYVWLSSSGGAHSGPSSGAPAHVARPPRRENPFLYLTEGALKATIAAWRLRAVCLGIAGVGTWRTVLGSLAALQEEGAHVVLIALDADDPAHITAVAAGEHSRQCLAAAAVQLGYAVRLARWRHTAGKGLDDLLLAGGYPRLEIYRPTLPAPL